MAASKEYLLVFTFVSLLQRYLRQLWRQEQADSVLLRFATTKFKFHKAWQSLLLSLRMILCNTFWSDQNIAQKELARFFFLKVIVLSTVPVFAPWF